jgi:hypothetical protein
VSESTRGQPAGTAAAEPARAYEPPRVEKLGSLRDLLAAKTGPGIDPSPVHPFAKK